MQILFATDGRAPAKAAGDLLARLADPTRVEVQVLHVEDPGAEGFAGGVEDIPAEAEKALLDAGVIAGSISRRGEPTACIDDELVTDRYGLVTVGAGNHSWMGRYVFGSVSNHVLHHARIPVLVVHRSLGAHDRLRVLVGTDGSPAVERAIDTLMSIAPASRVDVDVHAVVATPEVVFADGAGTYVPSSSLEQALEEARTFASEHVEHALGRFHAEGFEAHGSIGDGWPAAELLHRAASRDADLVVLGARRRGAIRKLAIGSVSAHVARHASATLIAHGVESIETDRIEEPNGDVAESRYPMRLG